MLGDSETICELGPYGKLYQHRGAKQCTLAYEDSVREGRVMGFELCAATPKNEILRLIMS